MNTSPSNLDERRDARFDDAMRQLHAASLAHVSPQLLWKLRPAPAMTGGVAGRFGIAPMKAWKTGAAFAAVAAGVFAVAIGFGLQSPGSAPVPSPALAVDDAASDGVGVLEQDPDFLAWLASDDANLIASVE